MAKFDFCQLGMKTPSATSVLRNSKHIAEVLRLAQCQGAHVHEPLVGGRAKACEVYPQKFVKLIVEGIKKEIQDAKWTRAFADKLDRACAGEDHGVTNSRRSC